MKQAIVIALAHTVAVVFSLLVFTGVPIMLYAILVIIGGIFYNDVGGLLNFVLVPILSVVLAFATTFIILLPITAFIQWFCSRFRIPKWLPAATIFPASFVAFSLVVLPFIRSNQITGTLIFLLVWCLVGSVCFAVYWVPLNLTEAILFFFWQFAGSVQGIVQRATHSQTQIAAKQ